MQLENTIIYLSGVPAVGKYTVAKEVARLSGAKVVDNQLINMPVFSVLGYDGTDSFHIPTAAWGLVDVVRAAVIAVIRDLCPPGDSFVLTNVLLNDTDGRATFASIEDVAARRNAAFFPVRLTCVSDVLMGRKNSPDRRARFKDTDVSSIPLWLGAEQLPLVHLNALTLDTSERTPTQSAELILEHIAARASHQP